MAASIRRGGRYRVTWHRKPSGLGALLNRQAETESTISYVIVDEGQAIRLQYQRAGGTGEVDERVAIARRPLTYGQRLFWLCPGCNRRAAILYYRAGWLTAGRFRCRHCHGLTYRSCQEADKRVYAIVRQMHDAPALDDVAALAALPTGDTLAELRGAFLLLKAYDIARKQNRRELRKLGVKTDDLPIF
jgi:hypothetical protein